MLPGLAVTQHAVNTSRLEVEACCDERDPCVIRSLSCGAHCIQRKLCMPAATGHNSNPGTEAAMEGAGLLKHGSGAVFHRNGAAYLLISRENLSSNHANVTGLRGYGNVLQKVTCSNVGYKESYLVVHLAYTFDLRSEKCTRSLQGLHQVTAARVRAVAKRDSANTCFSQVHRLRMHAALRMCVRSATDTNEKHSAASRRSTIV